MNNDLYKAGLFLCAYAFLLPIWVGLLIHFNKRKKGGHNGK